MDFKTKVEQMCKDKNVSVYRVERELGFGNGTIRSWGECTPSFDKFFAVCEYFGVDPNEVARELKEATWKS